MKVAPHPLILWYSIVIMRRTIEILSGISATGMALAAVLNGETATLYHEAAVLNGATATLNHESAAIARETAEAYANRGEYSLALDHENEAKRLGEMALSNENEAERQETSRNINLGLVGLNTALCVGSWLTFVNARRKRLEANSAPQTKTAETTA
jgi:hypothetical protein